MNRKTLLLIITILCICFIIFGVVFLFKPKEFLNNDNSDEISEWKTNREESLETIPMKEIIIGVSDCLLGKVQEGKWYKALYSDYSNNLQENVLFHEFYLEEIKAYDKLYLHQYGKEVKEITDYIDEENSELQYYVDESGKINDVHFRFKTAENFSEEDGDNFKILTNSEKDIFPFDMKEIVVTESYQNIVNKVKKEKNIEGANTQIDKIIEVDYDLDGQNEYFIVVNMKKDSLGYSEIENGIACSFIICVDDDKSHKIVYEYIVKDIENEDNKTAEVQFNIGNIEVCDINNDGIAELITYTLYWDIPEYSIYEFNKITKDFKNVITGIFPW